MFIPKKSNLSLKYLPVSFVKPEILNLISTKFKMNRSKTVFKNKWCLEVNYWVKYKDSWDIISKGKGEKQIELIVYCLSVA